VSQYKIVYTIQSESCPDQGHIERVAIDVADRPPKLLKSADVLLALAMGHSFHMELPASDDTPTVVGWVCRTCHLNTLRYSPSPIIENALETLPVC
jgi:hypothetical protein